MKVQGEQKGFQPSASNDPRISFNFSSLDSGPLVGQDEETGGFGAIGVIGGCFCLDQLAWFNELGIWRSRDLGHMVSRNLVHQTMVLVDVNSMPYGHVAVRNEQIPESHMAMLTPWPGCESVHFDRSGAVIVDRAGVDRREWIGR